MLRLRTFSLSRILIATGLPVSLSTAYFTLRRHGTQRVATRNNSDDARLFVLARTQWG
jgi:hypothetical protein